MSVRMLSELTLVGYTTAPDSTGKAVTTATNTVVYAEEKGVKRSEFYGAAAAGQKVDAVFEINTDEYTGQKDAIFGGVTYKISRSYPVNQRRTEIVCVRK